MEKGSDKGKYICRYTSLPFLLDILHNKRLTLISPEKWDDKNDIYFMKLYKNRSGMGSVLALCFVEYNSKNAEKYHHWKVYSGHTSGVCIQFYRDKLTPYLDAVPGITYRTMTYWLVNDLETEAKNIPWKDLPFIKRKAYDGETEFRIIYETKSENVTSQPITIGLDSISKITLNPWIEGSENNSVYEVIREMDGCGRIKLGNTTVRDYKKWKSIGKQISQNPNHR